MSQKILDVSLIYHKDLEGSKMFQDIPICVSFLDKLQHLKNNPGLEPHKQKLKV